MVEAILFASDAPLSPGEIARADEALDEDRVEAALAALKAEYDDSGRSFELREIADGVQLVTRPEFAPYLERFDTVPKSSRLSGPALEALAIVAYRQPISRVEVEYIRGVNSTGVIRTLVDRELIRSVGRGEGVGRPVLYGTSPKFMEHFGFPSMEHLPRPDELPVILRDPAPLEDSAEPGDEEQGGVADPVDGSMDPRDAVAAVLAHAAGESRAASGAEDPAANTRDPAADAQGPASGE